MPRPRIKQPFSQLDRLLLIINTSVIASNTVFCFVSFPDLPQIIPTHFDVNGVADKFGDKSSIWFLPAISLLLSVGLWSLSFYPHILNYLAEITQDNAPQQYALASKLLRVLSILVSFIFSFAIYETIVIAENSADSFVWLPMIIIVFGFITLLGVYLVQSTKN